MNLLDLERFLAAYIDCALWSSTDNATPSGGDPLDKNYTSQDLTRETAAKMRWECCKFVQENLADLADMDPEQAGHDFWLTRNGHGAGFWDRDLGALGDRLSKASEAFGECDLFVTARGRLSI